MRHGRQRTEAQDSAQAPAAEAAPRQEAAEVKHLALITATLLATQAPISPESIGEGWFLLCISIEAVLMLICYFIRTPASVTIAVLSGVLSVLHVIGWAEWVTMQDFGYTSAARQMEWLQVLCLFLFSPWLLARISKAVSWASSRTA